MREIKLNSNVRPGNACYASLLALLLCLSTNAYSQTGSDAVTVELAGLHGSVRKAQSLKLRFRVKNNTQDNLYLVVNENPTKSRNIENRALGLGLDKQPVNFHHLDFPKLRKLEPKDEIKMSLNLPLSAWKVEGAGAWKLTLSVGILDKRKLERKLEDLGLTLNDEIQMNVPDFLSLQSVYYSNQITINVSK